MRPPEDEHPAVTAPTRPCAHGCTQRAQHHAAGADGNPTCPAQQDPPRECRGCLPRPATRGTLCAWCWQRLHADVVDTPHLVRHLRAVGYPDAAQPPPADTKPIGDPAYADTYPDAWAEADYLTTELIGWARVLEEEHPARLTVPADGVWWTTQTARTYDGQAHVELRRPAGLRTMDALDRVVRWLLPHLPWVVEQEWAADMRAALATRVSTARAKYPDTDRGRHITGLPCPRCDHETLWYDPPTQARPMMQVACTNPDCGRIFTEDEWDRLRRLIRLAHERKLLA